MYAVLKLRRNADKVRIAWQQRLVRCQRVYLLIGRSCLSDEPGFTDGSADAGNENKHKDRFEPDDDQHTDQSVVTLSDFERPHSLTLDVAREDVYHSDWTETMEATVPGDQSNTGYVTRLHVQAEDRPISLDEVLTHHFPEKSAFRVKVQLVYSGPIEFRDRFSGLIDFVIFPGISANLEEAMAAEIPYSRYERRSHAEALLDAKTDIEHYRQSDQDSDD